jgi:hypothetical protein
LFAKEFIKHYSINNSLQGGIMKSMNTIFISTIFIFGSILAGCGSSSDIPSVEANLGDATTFIAYSVPSSGGVAKEFIGKTFQHMAGKVSPVLHSIDTSEEYSGNALIKYTTGGQFERAITFTGGNNKSVAIEAMARLSNGYYYVLFNGLVKIGEEKCNLIEIDATTVLETVNPIKCISSEGIPAGYSYSLNTKLPRAEAARYLFVTKDASGNIYYTSEVITQNQGVSPRLAVKYTDGTRSELITDDQVHFDRVVVDANMNFYGLGCIRTVGGSTYYNLCKIDTSAKIINSLDGDYLNYFGVPGRGIWALSDDRFLISGWYDNFEPADQWNDYHLRVGNAGDSITLANYSTDLKGSTSDEDLLMDTSSFDNVFETDGDKIYAVETVFSGGVSATLLQLAPAVEKIPLDPDMDFVKAMDYLPGGNVIIAMCKERASESDPVNCKAIKLNPSDNTVTPLYFLQTIEVSTLRYLNQNTLLFGGYSATEGNYQYFKYNLLDDSSELMLVSSGGFIFGF